MGNPFLSRGERHSKQSRSYWRSPKQEKNLAKRLSGFRTPGSGSKHKKGDVYVSRIVRIEAKTTQRKSFAVTREMLSKISHAGLAADELPVIVIEFLDPNGKPEGEIAVCPMLSLEGLITLASGSRNK